jgi:AraC-like DNA-binding protein
MHATPNPVSNFELSSRNRQCAIHALLGLSPYEGYSPTVIEGVGVVRLSRPLPRLPVLCDPGITILYQGRMLVSFGERSEVYDEQRCLVVPMAVPFCLEADVTSHRPLVALHIKFDFALAAELATQIACEREPDDAVIPQCMISMPVDDALFQSARRLIDAMSHPLSAAVLAPGLLRELHFRMLTGACGSAIRAAVAMSGPFHGVRCSLNYIERRYAHSLYIPELAAQAAMSVSSFHSHFKAIVRVSPMQYIKAMRLHEARRLMACHGFIVSRASRAVGYTSESQFSREYRRHFGLSPSAQARRVRQGRSVPMLFGNPLLPLTG